MIELLRDNPLLLLFVVAGIGSLVGQIKIGGISLGVAAVLFVGLAIGSLDPALALPELFYQMGLVIFVYTVGLSSGPGFFASFRLKGLRDNLLVIAMLILATLLAVGAHELFGLKPTLTVGVFTGSLTNTPALASVLDYIKSYASPVLRDQMLNEPVVAYSVTYPMGVLGMILLIYFLQRLWKVDYAREAQRVRELGALSVRLQNRTIRVSNPEANRATIQELIDEQKWDVVFGRINHNGHLTLVNAQTRLDQGDLVSAIGTRADLDRVTAYLGQASDERLEMDRSEFDYRRIFVSNAQVAGHRLLDLNLPQQFGAIVTRVRRGDIEMLAHDDTVLELGDRVRVVTRRENMDAVSKFFGDSYRVLSEIDILTFSLGLAVGLLVGIVPLPLPGAVVLKLGLAGGPLVVALVLGTLRRTGPLIWSLPYSANLTLRQIGLILFLAGVGTRSGYAFLSTFTQRGGFVIFVAGVIITCATGLATLYIGSRLFKIPMGLLTGMLAGLQTQPAVLGFALKQADNDLPNVGYATAYPIATIAKVVLAQLLIIFLR